MWTVLILDQVTKYWIEQTLPFNIYHFGLIGEQPKTVIENLFYIVHIGNTGAAWGMLSDYGFALGVLAVLTLGVIYLFRHSLYLFHPVVQLSFGLITGGIIGNLLDRFFRGHVVDFLDVHLPLVDYRWPAFNVADSGICVGVILYIASSFFCKIEEPERAKEAAAEESGKLSD